MLITAVSSGVASAAGLSAGIVATTSGSLNVRASASVSSQILASLPKNSYVTLVSESGSWWKVSYASGKYGYCSSQYISRLNSSYEAYVTTQSGNLNVRSAAGTSNSVKATLANGTRVVALSESAGWSKILYNGVYTGYVSSSYLKNNLSTAYSPIRLSVASYKQTDSRWASTRLGSSYETISSAGCTTTCLAMTESYRTGSVIYPGAMAKTLSYSSSGSLYWPSNYLTSTSSQNYLLTIYNLLKSGKPVVFGAKKASGSQHWVVITGYNGSTASLTASGFTINDPGSDSRTTLADLLRTNPYFYKIAYYS